LRDLLLDAETLWNQSNDTTVAFRGHLATDSNQAYPILRERFAELGYTPLLRRQQQFDIVVAIRHVFKSRQTHWGVNLILLLLTICSTTLMGAFQHQMNILAMQNIQPEMNTFIQLFLQKPWLILTGIPASLTIMGILGAHELAHYFVARSHKLASSLPYFIPIPLSPVGTMGAVIRTHIPWENRQALFDVGIAGPIAGMLVALPIFFIGLLFSPISSPLPLGEPLPSPLLLGWIEDLVYVIRQVPPGQDIYINTVSYFAWFGLIITGFNLLPVGQLDGGHGQLRRTGPVGPGLGDYHPDWHICTRDVRVERMVHVGDIHHAPGLATPAAAQRRRPPGKNAHGFGDPGFISHPITFYTNAIFDVIPKALSSPKAPLAERYV
jgi:Zn-dependent protease